MRLYWTNGYRRCRYLGGRLTALKEEVEKYLNESDEFEAKWGNFLIMEEKYRPPDMPPKPTPPYELVLYSQCKSYNTMLVEGGIFDQPYYTWRLVHHCGIILSDHDDVKNRIREINEKRKNATKR